MHLHSFPHHVNYGLVRMFAGVVVLPTFFLAILFLIAHHV